MSWSAARRTLGRGVGVAAFCCTVGTVAILALGVRGAGQTTPEFARWPFLDMWIRWDAGWYQAIATAGYYFSASGQSAVAYFPLYPALMRLGVAAGANVFLAGMGVTFLCGMGALVTFRAWAERLGDPAAAETAVWLVALWPFAFYLYGAVYSDALFLLLVVGAFLCLERGQLGVATVLGALATATRPIAPAVVLGLLVRQLELRRRGGLPWRAVDGLPALSGLGLVVYMAFLAIRFGDPLAFVTTQAGWHQTPGVAWLGKFTLTAGLLASAHPEDALLPLFHFALALVLFALGWPVRRRLGWGYAVYVWVVLGIPLLASRDFISLGRYGLAAFPSFLVLARLLVDRPRVRRVWMAATVVFLVWMVSKFAMGRYVA